MDAVLDPVLQSPKLKLYWDQIGRRLEQEAADRKKFLALPEGTRAEFINGEIIFKMADRRLHLAVMKWIARLLSFYVERDKLGEVHSDGAAIHLTRNAYEPDVCFWEKSVTDAFDEKTIQFPVPQLIVEIASPSTENYDRTVKFADYAWHGVAEYWIVNAENRVLEQFILRDGEFAPAVIHRVGDTLVSTSIRGFSTELNAFFDEAVNTAAVAAILAAR